MEHRKKDEVARIAGLRDPRSLTGRMSETDRLHRWVKLLEAVPRRELRTLQETEFRPSRVREGMRNSDTAITVAYQDPVLRAQGLAGDTYGDAKAFFGLTDPQLHHVICGCHVGSTMSARAAARRIERFLPGSMRPGLMQRALRALSVWR